jgi:hypothetical protein
MTQIDQPDPIKALMEAYKIAFAAGETSMREQAASLVGGYVGCGEIAARIRAIPVTDIDTDIEVM